jgi:multimeric flavodoxin WrbA
VMLLGLSAGAIGGSAEILLKEALRGAEASGAEVELVRLAELDLSTAPTASSDHAQWFWDRLMESDGLVVSSPICARTLPGLLRLRGEIDGRRQQYLAWEPTVRPGR